MIVTAVTAVTGLVAIAKVAVVAFAATVTEAGTVAALRLLLARFTTAPPAGAAMPSVTVPVLTAAPVTAVGLTVTPVRAAGGQNKARVGIAKFIRLTTTKVIL